MLGNILDEVVVVDHMQRALTKAAVNFSTMKAVSDDLLKNDDLLPLIAAFVPNYVEGKLDRVKKKEFFAGSRIKVRELSPSPIAFDPSNDDDIPFQKKKNRRLHRNKKY